MILDGLEKPQQVDIWSVYMWIFRKTLCNFNVHKDYVRVCTPTETLSTVHVYVKENATLK